MHKSLLKKLYDGEIYPEENIYLQKPQDKMRRQTIFSEDAYFQKILSGEDYNRLEQLHDLRHEEMSAYLYANFLYGYRLGMGFAIEAFTNEDLEKLNN